MMKKKIGQKHLHELLGEEQEPFLLNSYVADRSFRNVGTHLVNTQQHRQQLQLKKQRPGSSSSLMDSMFSVKGSCFSSSFKDSPDNRRSCPVHFNVLRSPKSPDSLVSLYVPAKTAALLLQAAIRIQNNSSPSKQDRPSAGIPGFRLFGSLLKRLTHRNWTDLANKQKFGFDQRSRCGCDSEGHCSSSETKFEPCENTKLEPQPSASPFRFVLQRSPLSHHHHPPEVTSTPSSSPVCQVSKDKGRSEPDSLTKLMVGEDEEEEKEQCSPVCVLDPPFEDDDDEDPHGHGDCSHDGFDYDSSFAAIHRAKQQLLHKLYMFEKLAGLDPTDLEKRLLQHDIEENDGIYEPECAGFIFEEVLGKSYEKEENVPNSTKRTKRLCSENRENVTKGVCKRLQQWDEADFDKIDMMVEGDMCMDHDGWIKSDNEQVTGAAKEIEAAIFGLMLQEVIEDLPRFPQ